MDPFNREAATLLRDLLRKHSQRIVFAESCTAGLIAASLGRLPGISEWLAGSAVVYQLETKAEWLSVDQQALVDPGPVSRIVSDQMARGVLEMTPHATVSASVTGHLGPDAPQDQDGVAWSSVAIRTVDTATVVSRKLQLDEGLQAEIARHDPMQLRQLRQINAVRQVLQFCTDELSG
jgi:nicotinamide-nucleotide amidase